MKSNVLLAVTGTIMLTGGSLTNGQVHMNPKPCNCFSALIVAFPTPRYQTCGSIVYQVMTAPGAPYCFVSVSEDSGTCDYTFKCEAGAAGVKNYSVTCSINVMDRDAAGNCVPGSEHMHPFSISNCKQADPNVSSNPDGCGGWQ